MSGKKIVKGLKQAVRHAKDRALTDNDLALAWFACGHAAHFWKVRGAGSYGSKEVAKYDALSSKFSKLLDEREMSQ